MRTVQETAAVTLAERFELLQRTAAELVRAPGADGALALLARRAGSAVDADAFALVAQLDLEEPPRVYGFGTAPTAGEHTVVVDIASPARRYGHLAARGEHLRDAERKLLEAYAGLAAVTLDALAAVDRAAERRRTAESLLSLARRLTNAVTVDEVSRVTAEEARDVMRADAAAVLFVDDGVLRLAALVGFTPEQVAVIDRAQIPAAVAEQGAAPRTHTLHTAGPVMRNLLPAMDLDSVDVVNVVRQDRVYGVLVTAYSRPQKRGRDFETRMSGIADQAATALHTCELLEQTWRLAHVDPLTGLANRRAFMADLDAAVRAGDGTLLYIDLDGFKQVNDTLGHRAGDELLVAVAADLRTVTGPGDLVARLGGDEFVLLTHDAADPTSRVRAALRAPASVGGTPFRAGEDAETVLHRADTAMYAVKLATVPGPRR